MTTRTPAANFKGFSQTIKEQSGEKRHGFAYISNGNNLKIRKLLVLPIRHCGTIRGQAIFELCNQISMQKHEKFRETIASSCVAQVESFEQ